MTEEIIIDGVNVAGCEFCKPNPLYKIEYACHCRGCVQDDGLHVHLSCEHNPNCYYKQLKRLEQENKELKEVKEQLKKWNDENLKRQDDMQLWIDLAEEQRKKYRSALEEIQKTIKSYELAVDNGASVDTLYTIGKIINEVLNDN